MRDLTVEERVNIGKEVREILDLLGHRPVEFWESFIAELKRRDLLQATKDIDIEELTEGQAKAFGEILCPFQKYKGIPYSHVPYDYLAFITDKNRELDKYVKWRFKHAND